MRCFAENAAALARRMMPLLGWPPETFWAATPADVEMMLTGLQGVGATDGCDAVGLAAMLAAFPDDQGGEERADG